MPDHTIPLAPGDDREYVIRTITADGYRRLSDAICANKMDHAKILEVRVQHYARLLNEPSTEAPAHE